MPSLRLSRLLVAARRDELASLAEIAEQLRSVKGNRVAAELLLNGIGFSLNPALVDSYYREALDFQLGQLYAYLEEPERAADYFQRSGSWPFTGGNRLYSDALAEGQDIRRRQQAAAARGMPPILIASMPRSASASITQSIAATLDIPVLRLSVGDFPNYFLVPSWLQMFLPGGAVTHDHFGASPYNLKVLKDAGWREVFVVARDPRAAAASVTHMQAAHYGRSLADIREQAIVEQALNSYIPWLNEWAAVEDKHGIRVHWLKSRDAIDDMSAAIRQVWDVLRQNYPALAASSEPAAREVRANFVTGKDDLWRTLISPPAQRRLWDAISRKARRILDLDA